MTGRDGRVWDGFLVPAAGANVLDDLDPLRLLLFAVLYFCWPCDWTVWGYCEPVRRRWRLVGRMESIGEVGRLCLTITHNGGPGLSSRGFRFVFASRFFFSCVMLRRRVPSVLRWISFLLFRLDQRASIGWRGIILYGAGGRSKEPGWLICLTGLRRDWYGWLMVPDVERRLFDCWIKVWVWAGAEQIIAVNQIIRLCTRWTHNSSLVGHRQREARGGVFERWLVF